MDEHGYTAEELGALREFYKTSLLDDTLPFWLPRCLDTEHGGYLTALDRDGSLIDDDKSVWVQGRFAWLLGTLYHSVEPREEWLEAARSGVYFLRDHCFDEDDRMFFLVTREGKPLRKRRYFFSEAFTTMAFAAYGKAAGCEDTQEQARQLFRLCVEYIEGRLPTGEPKWTDVRPSRSIGVPMIYLQVAQQLVHDQTQFFGGNVTCRTDMNPVLHQYRLVCRNNIGARQRRYAFQRSVLGRPIGMVAKRQRIEGPASNRVRVGLVGPDDREHLRPHPLDSVIVEPRVDQGLPQQSYGLFTVLGQKARRDG